MKRIGEGRSYDLMDVLGKLAKRREAAPARVVIAWLLARREASSVI